MPAIKSLIDLGLDDSAGACDGGGTDACEVEGTDTCEVEGTDISKVEAADTGKDAETSNFSEGCCNKIGTFPQSKTDFCIFEVASNFLCRVPRKLKLFNVAMHHNGKFILLLSNFFIKVKQRVWSGGGKISNEVKYVGFKSKFIRNTNYNFLQLFGQIKCFTDVSVIIFKWITKYLLFIF